MLDLNFPLCYRLWGTCISKLRHREPCLHISVSITQTIKAHHNCMSIIISTLWFPSHLTPLTFFRPPSPDFRYNRWAAAVCLWPSDLHGGAIYRQQTLPGVDAELPEAVRQRGQPPLLHLPGSVQCGLQPGEWQQYQRCVHHSSDSSSSLRGSYSGADQRLDAQPLLTWLGGQHTDGQWGLQVRLQSRWMTCWIRLKHTVENNFCFGWFLVNDSKCCMDLSLYSDPH